MKFKKIKLNIYVGGLRGKGKPSWRTYQTIYAAVIGKENHGGNIMVFHSQKPHASHA